MLEQYLSFIPKKIIAFFSDDEQFIEGSKEKWKSLSNTIEENYNKTYQKVLITIR